MIPSTNKLQSPSPTTAHSALHHESVLTSVASSSVPRSNISVGEGSSSSPLQQPASSNHLRAIAPIKDKLLNFAQKVNIENPNKFIDEFMEIAQPYQAATQFQLNKLSTKVIDLEKNNAHSTLLQWAEQAFPDKSDKRYQFISQKTYETKINSALSTKLQNAVAFLSNESPQAQKSFIADFAAGVAGFDNQCGAEAQTRITESFERLEYGLTEGLSTQNIGSKGNVGDLHAKISVLTLKHEMQRFHHWFDQAYTNTTERTGPYRQHRDTYLRTGSTSTQLPNQPILKFDLNALVKSLHKSITAFHAPQDIVALRKNITQQFPQLVYSNPNEPSGEIGDFIAYNQNEAFIMSDQLLPSLLADAGIIQLTENGRLQLEPMALAFETFSKAIQQLDLPSDARNEIKEIMNLQQAKIEQTIREAAPAPTQTSEQYQTQESAQTIPTRTDLRGVRLSRQQVLDIIQADRNHGERANLHGVNLHGVNLHGVNLSDAHLRGADLRGADLRGADLSGADLSGADLRGADLSGADLSGADLRDVNLRGADLRGADLRGADLSGALLRYVNLRYVNLRDVNLRDVNLSGADLSGADLSGATLIGTIISRQQLKSVGSLEGASLGAYNRLKSW